ncbi:hypothetical protein CNMCM6936_008044 [Aspergillus lentulus]|uniref:Uncharacterized protein n=1 Tax=Aspergillus lentulus TaxID=293939 RepID=A0AAN5YKE7_ASPLE|nr:hypothetical protein CNMCM6069_002103 [Aspergillus lentulus]KAF4165256.1 hypothetical protein CNMCM6936_008044 [Aspergillus lentulus]KAF4173981.1 hypothetical protein CNMCM8060_009170 [Aspergillus lentulus]KAF4186499.1 hypothetical protein CNMCM7927_005464 [Aspergillus lentulus]KAF4194054.1 hypothetical protein CNMCM8694_008026 [Aspergillus lentulus]
MFIADEIEIGSFLRRRSNASLLPSETYSQAATPSDSKGKRRRAGDEQSPTPPKKLNGTPSTVTCYAGQLVFVDQQITLLEEAEANALGSDEEEDPNQSYWVAAAAKLRSKSRHNPPDLTLGQGEAGIGPMQTARYWLAAKALQEVSVNVIFSDKPFYHQITALRELETKYTEGINLGDSAREQLPPSASC